MQPVSTGRVQSAINVTPLVDVVLVLLIIFMVIAPELQTGPQVQLPETDQPPKKPDNGKQITVSMEENGTIWVGSDAVRSDEFAERMQEAAAGHEDWHVVIKGDARLTFGEVKQAMLAVENAGFADVGLIAEAPETTELGI